TAARSSIILIGNRVAEMTLRVPTLVLEMSSRRAPCTVRTNRSRALRASEVERITRALALSQPQRLLNTDLPILENAFCRSRHKTASQTVRFAAILGKAIQVTPRSSPFSRVVEPGHAVTSLRSGGDNPSSEVAGTPERTDTAL